MATGLTHRVRTILFSVVAEYIASGRPVGSRTLARRYGLKLSPATIRNVLADLEEAGYLHQPHASAGRTPTDRALRLFIEALTEFEEIPIGQRSNMRQRLTEIFARSGENSPELSRWQERSPQKQHGITTNTLSPFMKEYIR